MLPTMGGMKHQISHFIVALTASTEAGGVPRDIQLLPAGSFRATDGRPADVPAWVLTRADAERIIAAYAARTNPAVIDFEHQTLLAKTNGQPAPASGWFKSLEWREPSSNSSGADSPGGLWAINVDWTAAAARMIAGGEYKFISPVFTYDKTGHVQRLLHAALTNDPALDGMAAVAAAFDFSSTTTHPDQEHVMNPEMLKLLGLASDATPEQVNAALVALNAKVTEAGAQVTALTQRVAAADEQIAVLKTSHQPGEVVAALKEQLAVLTAESVSRKIDDLVKPALANGRLLPAQESWARDLGKTNLAALSTYIETAQPIVALTGTQSAGRAPEDAAPKLTAEELAACTLLGQNPDEYLAFKSTSTSTHTSTHTSTLGAK